MNPVSGLQPSRGEIWTVDLDPTRGHEQAGRRPALVVSIDPFNHGPAGLAVVLPVTSRAKGIPFHVRVDPPEGGLTLLSFIKCEDVRSVSQERLIARLGVVTPQTLLSVEDRLRILLDL
jgi:mRNA interferase MazF